MVWREDSGWHTLEFGDVEITVVPEGGRARRDVPSTIPGPDRSGVAAGLGYAELPGWVELKISSGRQKDLTHVVEVLKRLEEPQFQAATESIRHRLDSVEPRYGYRFEELVQTAREELDQ